MLRQVVKNARPKPVTATLTGQTAEPLYILQPWDRCKKGTKLTRPRFHDLRLAHATHIAANGILQGSPARGLGIPTWGQNLRNGMRVDLEKANQRVSFGGHDQN